MGLFSRKTRPSPVEAAPAATSSTLDAIADLARGFGRHAFDLPNETAEKLERRMEDWAKRVVRPDEDGAVEELKLVFLRRRQAEKKYVPKALKELKGALMEALASLSEAVGEDVETADRLLTRLSELANAVDTDDLTQLQNRVRSTVEDLSKELERSRQRAERRIVQMGEHVEVLQADLVKAKKKSATDSLTGLYNRSAFDQDFDRISRLIPLTNQPLSVVMVDIDHFKQVNDTYGHPAGDIVIRNTADELVRAYPRKSDYVARYGGEEFVVILRDANLDDALKMTERLLDAIRSTPVDCDGTMVEVTCSAGVAQVRRGESTKALLARADAMLYRAKRNGRDRVVVDR